MDEKRARLILESYRPGADDPGDPQFAEALQEIASNPGLAEWFAEEQAFDRAITAQLETVAAPFGLKTRILANATSPPESRQWSWAVKLAAVAALLFLLVQVVSLFRGSAPALAGVQDYAREMVSFVRIDPPLEMESNNLGAIKNWLTKRDAAPMDIPPRLAALQPVGCRILSFRGQEVTLICFRREGDRLAHLFVVDRAAMPKMKPGEKPVFADTGEWTTASWVEKDRVYMIAVQGDRAAVERYLPST
jgi:anti-sigma factor RsiW